MKIFIYHSGHTPYVKNLISEISEHIELSHSVEDADIFLSLQMGNYKELIGLHNQFPDIPFVTYVWDCYDWIWDNSYGYDWKSYGELCKISDLILVPSEGQRDRLVQHWDIPKEKSKVVKAYAQLFDYDGVCDNRYVCDPLREIPDKHAGWAERACKELDIPYMHGGRKSGGGAKSWDDYKKMIAESTFIICPWYEASTGGMSLIEGYSLGKEILICNSMYMGAKDYFGDRANYFEPSYYSMRESIKALWDRLGYEYHVSHNKEFCEKEFSIKTMAKNISSVLEPYAFRSISDRWLKQNGAM